MKKSTIIWVIVLVLFAGGVAWLVKTPGKAGAYDGFAQCIKDSGATFYGAFWCPHCQNQKALFGSSAKLLPYVECSTPDGKSQLPVCTEAGVQGYPTWQFADGSRKTGELTFFELSQATQCELPK
jgi:hypothetical protein